MAPLANASLQQTFAINESQQTQSLLELLDAHFPLREASHEEVTQYRVYYGKLLAHLKSGRCTGLATRAELEFEGDDECPSLISLKNPRLQVELYV